MSRCIGVKSRESTGAEVTGQAGRKGLEAIHLEVTAENE